MTVDIATLAVKVDTPDLGTAARAVDGLSTASTAAQTALAGLADTVRKVHSALALLGSVKAAQAAKPAAAVADTKAREAVKEAEKTKEATASEEKKQRGILPTRVEALAAWQKIVDAAKTELDTNLKIIGDVFVKGAEDTYKTGKAGWEKFTKTLGDTLAGAARSQAKLFVDGLVAQGKDLLKSTGKRFYEDIIRDPVKKFFGFGGATAAGGASAAPASGLSALTDALSGNDSGGAGGMVSLFQKAKGAYDTIAKGFSGISESVSGGVQSVMNFFSGGSAAAGNAAPGALASGVGAAAGIAAGVAGGVMGGRFISGQYGSNATVNAGTAIGAAVGSIIPGLGTAVGALVGGLLGGVANRAFGMGEKKVTSQGISGTLGASGFSGQTYANWQQKGGWLRSDKSGTDRSAVDDATSKALGDGYQTLLATSASLAKVLGVNTDAFGSRSQKLDIAFKDNDAAGNQKAITDFFTGVGDTIANELVPNLASFSKAGEAAGVTLQRIAGNYVQVDAVLTTLGKNSQDVFGAVGLASVAAREQLVNAAGGIEALSSGTAYFAQNFMTQAEQMAPVVRNVQEQMAAMGYSGVSTNEQFKDLVTGLDLSSAAGARQYAQLLLLAPQFKQMTDYTIGAANAVKNASEVFAERKSLQQEFDQLTMTSTQLLAQQRDGIDASNRALFDGVQAAKAAQTAREALATAYDRENNALKATIDNMTSFATGLRSFRDSLALGNMSPLSPEQKYAEAQAQYERTLAAAQGGDATAQGSLQQVANAFLAASQVANASDDKYRADYMRVLQSTNDMIKWADAQVDVGKASLTALEKQVSGLIDINTSVLSVNDAIKQLALAMAGVDLVNGAKGAPAAASMTLQSSAAGIDYRNMGTSAMEPLVAEIRSLRSANEAMANELKGLRADQQEQTGAIIGSNDAAHERSAGQVVSGSAAASENAVWAQQSKATIL